MYPFQGNKGFTVCMEQEDGYDEVRIDMILAETGFPLGLLFLPVVTWMSLNLYFIQYGCGTFSTMERNGGEDFTYTNISDIEPLKNGTLVYLAEVPDEVQSGDKPLYAEVKIEGQNYRYTIR